jgi:IclR family transcriptional regulator, acetate operon repressor
MGHAEVTGAMQTVSRVARILRALDGEHRGLTLSELADRTGLPRSTVHRLTTALAAERLVIAAPLTSRTRLGPELARLAAGARVELRDGLRPHLEALHGLLDETIGLSLLEGDSVRFIDQLTTNHPLQAVTAVGSALPAWSSASGRALLARLRPEQREALVPRRLVAHAPSTTTDRDLVMAAIERAARDGIAVTREEYTEGVCAAAVAVRDAFGDAAAISVSAPTARFSRREDAIAFALLDVRARTDHQPTTGETCSSST